MNMAKRTTAKRAGSSGKRVFGKEYGRKALAVATDSKKTTSQRVAALVSAPLAVSGSETELQRVLKVLANPSEPVKVRLAALDALQTATFDAATFSAIQSDFIATLRKIADDPDHELRQRVLGILMREKDGYAQKKLLDGLKNPAKALLPPEKALQLLSNDLHAEVYSIARDILKKPPNDDAKREALRLLAADTKATPIFEKVLRDKKELRENRQIAASALHALNPDKLQSHARKILLDKSDFSDIKATSLTALEQFGDDAALGKDKKLIQSVNRFRSTKVSPKYKQTAKRFLSKFGA
jgi:hypothetical protein